MQADEIAAIAGVAQAILALATLIATATVTVLVYFGTRTIARIEHDRGIRDAWNNIDALALADESILQVAESLLPQPGSGTRTSAEAKRKWLAFMLLNTLSSMYNAARRGVTRSRADALLTCEYQLSSLVR